MGGLEQGENLENHNNSPKQSEKISKNNSFSRDEILTTANLVKEDLETSPISAENKHKILEKLETAMNNWKEEMDAVDKNAITAKTKANNQIFEEFEEILNLVDTIMLTDLSVEEAEEYAKKHFDKLGFLLGKNSHKKLRSFLKIAENRVPIKQVQYDWRAMQQVSDYPGNEGKKRCALTVSMFLGLPPSKRRASVRKLCADLIKGNMEKTGNAGICFGFENYQKGDVLVFKGIRDKETNLHSFYSHVALVRFKATLPIYDDKGKLMGKEPFLGIVDDGEHLEGTIVPVDGKSKNYQFLAKTLKNPKKRAEYFQKHPELTELQQIFEERKYVDVRNTAWFGDANQSPKNDILFAIRTEALVKKFDLVAQN